MQQASSVADLTIAGRTLVMGIVNVTTDSFSDGGKWIDPSAAVDHALQLQEQGADIIDVGGESTRPGATRVDPETERARVVPVIAALQAAGVRTSVDTMRADTALAAADAGVDLINDVSGGQADPRMLQAMARAGVPVSLMHWQRPQGASFASAAGRAHQDGQVVADVKRSLNGVVANALEAGVSQNNIVLDLGLGFAKSAADNWALLNALPEFLSGDYPLLVGASRKRFLAAIRSQRGVESGPLLADPATAAVTAIAAQLGAWGVRVHEVAASRDAVEVAALWSHPAGGTHPAGVTEKSGDKEK